MPKTNRFDFIDFTNGEKTRAHNSVTSVGGGATFKKDAKFPSTYPLPAMAPVTQGASAIPAHIVHNLEKLLGLHLNAETYRDLADKTISEHTQGWQGVKQALANALHDSRSVEEQLAPHNAVKAALPQAEQCVQDWEHARQAVAAVLQSIQAGQDVAQLDLTPAGMLLRRAANKRAAASGRATAPLLRRGSNGANTAGLYAPGAAAAPAASPAQQHGDDVAGPSGMSACGGGGVALPPQPPAPSLAALGQQNVGARNGWLPGQMHPPAGPAIGAGGHVGFGGGGEGGIAHSRAPRAASVNAPGRAGGVSGQENGHAHRGGNSLNGGAAQRGGASAGAATGHNAVSDARGGAGSKRTAGGSPILWPAKRPKNGQS